jgi:hypothetical protein
VSKLADIVKSRFSNIEKSASALTSLLAKQRKAEEDPPESQYALSSDFSLAIGGERESRFPSLPPPKPEEEERRRESEREAAQKRAWEMTRIARKYEPLEIAISTHMQGLASFKSDIESMIKEEGRRSFWKGIWVNAFFFVLGSAVSAVSLSVTQVFTIFGLK